jgi:pimeloyl-ACP methyl ester carboxylesterase
MPFVKADDGLKIYYEQRGSGSAVLLSHGFRASSPIWQNQMAALSDRYRVIVWDMRGHGRSDSPDDTAAYSLQSAVADMAAVLRECGAQRAAIGGLSLGGLVSLAFHVAYPDKTAALLLFDTGPGQRRVAARDGKAGVAGEPPGFAHTRRKILERSDDEIVGSLDSIRVPTLILCGEFDQRFLAASDLLATQIPGAQKVILKGAGHVSNLDQPDMFNRAVRSFLDRLPSWSTES